LVSASGDVEKRVNGLRRSFEEVFAELKNRNLQVELFEPPKLIEVNLREAAHQRRATRNRQDVA
jgi:hypothetical protein